jgi:hypothetical protein
MKIFETLKDLQTSVEKDIPAGDGKRREWLTLQPGESVRVHFRQELAKDGNGYDEELGLAHIVSVHTSPMDFKKKLACNLGEAQFDFRCWPDEQVAVEKRWRAKPHLLINVAVENNQEWTNKILDQTFARSHVASTLVEFASEYGSITEHEYKITRIGSGLQTTYSVMPIDRKPLDQTIKDLELFDLESVYRKISYEEQEEFFLKIADMPTVASSW